MFILCCIGSSTFGSSTGGFGQPSNTPSTGLFGQANRPASTGFSFGACMSTYFGFVQFF